ncbi:hypothetical protein CGRA01v4_10770 [Colletotrichum graminicola]|nr:hypothetical protein CGRA01v4_10770 [Colletotrichum graminicola]
MLWKGKEGKEVMDKPGPTRVEIINTGGTRGLYLNDPFGNLAQGGLPYLHRQRLGGRVGTFSERHAHPRAWTGWFQVEFGQRSVTNEHHRVACFLSLPAQPAIMCSASGL